MRFTILSQYFPPELGAPQQRLGELGAFIAARGHDVDVLTALPSYPKGVIFPGYERKLFMRERVGDIDVLRAFIYPSNSASIAPRLANYFSFVASSAIVGAAKLQRSDFLMVESPPLFLGMAGIPLAFLKRARLIFNVSDLWPESPARLGAVRRDSAVFKATEQLETLCYRSAWLVTGQSKSILDDIRRRHPHVDTYHLSNGCDTTKYGTRNATHAARAMLIGDGPSDAFVVLYAGLHGIAQGLDQILRVAERTRDNLRIRYVLIGDGPEKKQLVADARSRGLKNVRFLDPVPAKDVAPLLASADAIAVTLKMEIPGAVPSKIYEAMASEKPLILVASGEAAEIVKGADAGAVIEPGDVDSFANAVLGITSDAKRARTLGENGRVAATRHYDRRSIADRFIEMLEATVGGRKTEAAA